MEYKCPHCGKILVGDSNSYDLMRAHLASCESELAAKIRGDP